MGEPSQFPQPNKPNFPSSNPFENTKPWIEYASGLAQFYQHTLQESIDSFLHASKSRLSQIQSTSSAHLSQTLDVLDDVKSEYGVYEDIFFGKIKEGIVVARSHPMASCGIAAGLGLVALKKPRRLIYYSTLRRFVSEETLISRADAKMKKLRESVELFKADTQKVEKKALHGEEELKKGLAELREYGKKSQSLINEAHKIERQAADLKDICGELPRIESSRFRTQVSDLAKEVKGGEKVLSKQVAKISNYGISI